MTSMHGFGLGLATKNNKGEILEVFYPKPLCDLSGDLAGMLSEVRGELDDAALNELASVLLATGEEEQAGIAQQMRETSGTVIATPLTSNTAPIEVAALTSPQAIHELADVQYLYVEGGAGTAQAFLDAGLVDALHIYTAPITIGSGLKAPAALQTITLAEASEWRVTEKRQLGSDTFTAYSRA